MGSVLKVVCLAVFGMGNRPQDEKTDLILKLLLLRADLGAKTGGRGESKSKGERERERERKEREGGRREVDT